MSKDCQVKQLFQGPNPVSKDYGKGEIYKGDRELKSDNQITIQIHQVDLKIDKKITASNVPIVAVYIPNGLSTSVIQLDTSE